MRRTKPPVGWEKVRNCFPVPNELLDFDLPAGAVAVYIYLLRHANRKTNQCHPSEAIIAKKLHLSRNTVAKQVRLLEERGLVVTEHTTVITKQGVKRNGNLLYTILPIQFSIDLFYQRQMDAVDSAAQRSRGALEQRRARCVSPFRRLSAFSNVPSTHTKITKYTHPGLCAHRGSEPRKTVRG